jgi:hypothetical protein
VKLAEAFVLLLLPLLLLLSCGKITCMLPLAAPDAASHALHTRLQERTRSGAAVDQRKHTRQQRCWQLSCRSSSRVHGNAVLQAQREAHWQGNTSVGVYRNML